ncbi:MAG: SPFH domain-containing protein [Candidatus Falkowbacteria bacterium]
MIRLIGLIRRMARRFVCVVNRLTTLPFNGPNKTSVPVLLLLFIAGIFSMIISMPLGLMIIGATVVLVGLGFVEIKTPYLGFLYVRGRLVGQLDPGWYVIIPIIMSIQKKSQEIQKETITENMYTKEKTELVVKAVVFYQVIDLIKAVNISDEEIKAKVETLMASKTKTVIGKNNFGELNSKQDVFEDVR